MVGQVIVLDILPQSSLFPCAGFLMVLVHQRHTAGLESIQGWTILVN